MPLLVFGEGGGAPAQQGLTTLSAAGVPGQAYGPFLPRNPKTFVTTEPGSLAWTGRDPNVPLKLQLAPGDLRWLGRNVPTGASTHLSAAGTPGRTYGPFHPRAQAVSLVLDPGSLAWTGRNVEFQEVVLTAGSLAWTGKEVVVRVKGATQTVLSAAGTPGRAYGPFVSSTQTPDPGALNWTGQEVTVVAQVKLVLDPGNLAWTGKDLGTNAARLVIDLHPLEPLSGVR